MDQLIFASLSHDHYRYEVGMLKVPAYRKGTVSLVVHCTYMIFIGRILFYWVVVHTL